MNRYKSKAWQELFLPRLSKREIGELEKENGLIVLPIGAVEQHGPHLPVYTDTLIAEGILAASFNQLAIENNVWMLPPLAYGKSTEHLGHPGTITLSATTLQQVIIDIGKSVQVSGFRRIVLFNTHGGNIDLLNMIARELRIETGMMVFRMNAMDFKSQLTELFSEKELTDGIHGGDVETSLVLALEKDWVDMDYAPTEFYNSDVLDIKGGPFAAWVIDDLSETGISGDAKAATVEKGEEILIKLSKKIAETLTELSCFEMEQFQKKTVVK
ncbi:creatininase family protein [Halalkalibacter okhensis]|uniref:Creatininase n=1 Tax=Halalkalibacter okhensis TaxID=333138 RepID=A0A0B0INF4_9BACI|nr:creatininase family protein [Halalkalibacter okhensis]KHF41211.1 creatininase [Halalkalibacter okhensis]